MLNPLSSRREKIEVQLSDTKLPIFLVKVIEYEPLYTESQLARKFKLVSCNYK